MPGAVWTLWLTAVVVVAASWVVATEGTVVGSGEALPWADAGLELVWAQVGDGCPPGAYCVDASCGECAPCAPGTWSTEYSRAEACERCGEGQEGCERGMAAGGGLSVSTQATPPSPPPPPPSAACDTGYKGETCTECADEYYRVRLVGATGTCFKCPSSWPLLRAGGILGLFFFCCCLFVWGASRGLLRSSLWQLLSVCQLIALSSHIPASLPEWLAVQGAAASGVMGNMDLLALECTMFAPGDIYQRWTMSLLVLPVMALSAVCVYGMETLWAAHKRARMGDDTDTGYAILQLVWGSALRAGGPVVNGLVFLWVLVQPLLVVGTLRLLVCDPDTSRMHHSPEDGCYTSIWWDYMPPVAAVAVVSLGVIPGVLAFVLRRIRHKVHDRQVGLLFGSFFAIYHPVLYWWGLVRMAVCLLLTLIPSIHPLAPVHRSTLVMHVLFLYILLEASLRPYRLHAHTYLSLCGSCAAFAVAMAGMLAELEPEATDASQLVLDGGDKELVAQIAVGCAAAVVLVVCLAIARDIRRWVLMVSKYHIPSEYSVDVRSKMRAVLRPEIYRLVDSIAQVDREAIRDGCVTLHTLQTKRL